MLQRLRLVVWRQTASYLLKSFQVMGYGPSALYQIVRLSCRVLMNETVILDFSFNISEPTTSSGSCDAGFWNSFFKESKTIRDLGLRNEKMNSDVLGVEYPGK